MVCMIADYRKNGVDLHNEYIINGTSDYEKAVYMGAFLMPHRNAVWWWSW